MHELSIALSILDIAAEESQKHGDAMVRAVRIKLGPLAGVVKDALTSAFELARECSPFTDCRLIVDEIPIAVTCEACQRESAVASIQSLRCGHCGAFDIRVIRGTELEVAAMEIDDHSASAQPVHDQCEG